MKTNSALPSKISALPKKEQMDLFWAFCSRAFFKKSTIGAFVVMVLCLLGGDILEERFPAQGGWIEAIARLVGISVLVAVVVRGFLREIAKYEKRA